MMEFVSWDDDIPFPTEWKIIIQSCSKPPISLGGYSHPSNRSEHLTSQRNSSPLRIIVIGLERRLPLVLESHLGAGGVMFSMLFTMVSTMVLNGFNHGFNPCLRIFNGFNHVLTMF